MFVPIYGRKGQFAAKVVIVNVAVDVGAVVLGSSPWGAYPIGGHRADLPGTGPSWHC
jgi:hypothetical protein